MEVSHERFEALVAEALDLIPDDLAEAIDNLAVFVVDESPEDPELLGLYDGIPLTDREHYGGMIMPDRIFIYSQADLCPLRRRGRCRGAGPHHGHPRGWPTTSGIDDDRLEELGWD